MRKLFTLSFAMLIGLSAFASSNLPVVLESFIANMNKTYNAVDIQWQVSSELDIDRYEIERSFDGRRFATVKREVNIPNSSQRKTYTFTDYDYNKTTTRKVMYRLVTYNTDGSMSATRVLSVIIPAKKLDVQIHNNPVSTIFDFTIPTGGSVTIFNTTGSKLMEQAVVEGKNQIDVSTFQAGMYIINFVSKDGEVVSKQFIKK